MKPHKTARAALAAAVALLFLSGSASAMGKKAPLEKEKELGHGGTMKKTYDPETGIKRMEKTIGGGEKEMVLEKEPHSGAKVWRSWKTGPASGGASGGKGPSSHPGKGKGKGRW